MNINDMVKAQESIKEHIDNAGQDGEGDGGIFQDFAHGIGLTRRRDDGKGAIGSARSLTRASPGLTLPRRSLRLGTGR